MIKRQVRIKEVRAGWEVIREVSHRSLVYPTAAAAYNSVLKADSRDRSQTGWAIQTRIFWQPQTERGREVVRALKARTGERYGEVAE